MEFVVTDMTGNFLKSVTVVADSVEDGQANESPVCHVFPANDPESKGYTQSVESKSSFALGDPNRFHIN